LPYKPISCSFHDELESLAIRQRKVEINYWDNNNEQQSINSQIRDFNSRDGAEFMVLESNQTIRLDRIISVDGKHLNNYC